MTTSLRTSAALLLAAATACSSGGSSAGPATSSAPVPAATSSAPSPTPTPTGSFVAAVDNPYFPLVPGSRWVYTGVRDGEQAKDVVVVTRQTKVVNGVECVVVHDELFVNGVLAERTDDWYAQDRLGNVWYFGEDTAELDESGKVTSREGSWADGRDGAKRGIIIRTHPAVGQHDRQEYYRGHAEDEYRIVSVTASVTTRGASSKTAVLAEEFTRLDPDVLDHKYYVSGFGLVKEESVRGGDEHLALESYTRGS